MTFATNPPIQKLVDQSPLPARGSVSFASPEIGYVYLVIDYHRDYQPSLVITFHFDDGATFHLVLSERFLYDSCIDWMREIILTGMQRRRLEREMAKVISAEDGWSSEDRWFFTRSHASWPV